MAAITISSINLPNNAKTTLSGTPNTMQEYVIPSNAEAIEVQFISHPGVVVFSAGTDGAVISSQIGYPVAKDTSFFWNLPRSKGQHSVWLASGTGSTVVHIVVYEA